jgi:hypothetical protein
MVTIAPICWPGAQLEVADGLRERVMTGFCP